LESVYAEVREVEERKRSNTPNTKAKTLGKQRRMMDEGDKADP
jgi:hypothetical protein